MEELVQADSNHQQDMQLHPELIHTAGLHSFPGHVSASRGQMAATQVGQSVVLVTPTVKTIQSGTDNEFGKYMFNIRMPEDGRILAIVDRMDQYRGQGSVKLNPEQVVIYQAEATREIGMVSLVPYETLQGYFGYHFRQGKDAHLLSVGSFVPKDAILMEVSCVNDQGDFMYGREVNIAYMTHPGGSEDAIMVSESFLKNFKYTTYERVMISWGDGNFPLNLYGNNDVYRIFPDIGEGLREDGLLMTVRDIDKIPGPVGGIDIDPMAPIFRTNLACMKPAHATDIKYYVGGPQARVVNIEIHHDGKDKTYTPMDEQPLKYLAQSKMFAKQIVDLYKKYSANVGSKMNMSAPFHKLVVDCMAVLTPDRGDGRVARVYKQDPVGRWTAWITVEKTHTPGIGSKYTDQYAGKGVVSKVVPDDHMPVDIHGNRADMIMDPGGTMNRTIPARLNEQYLTGSARDLTKLISALVNIPVGTSKSVSMHKLDKNNPVVLQAWEHWARWYNIINPQVGQWIAEGRVGADKLDTICHILQHGASIYYPSDSPVEVLDVIRQLEATPYRPVYGPVSYVDGLGRRIVTKSNIRISSVYIIELNKPGTDMNAASITRLHPYGTPAVLTGADNYRLPYRDQASRGLGEAEGRGMHSYGNRHRPWMLPAELFDRNSSPTTLRHMANRILESDHPGAMYSLVDRNEVPFGTGRPLGIINHILRCAGIEFTYEPYKENHA